MAHRESQSESDTPSEFHIANNDTASKSETDNLAIAWEEEAEMPPTSLELEQLDKKIAQSIELWIKQVTGISLDYGPARIREVRIEKDKLMMSINLPFLSAPNFRIDEWPFSRRDLSKFADFLKNEKNQKLLHNFFYKQLVEFLISNYKLEKASQKLKALLQRTSQRSLAGRPATIFPRQESRRIASDGKAIYKTIRAIQHQVQEMKKHNSGLQYSAVLASLKREYSLLKYPWIAYFFKFGERLPRRRYSPSRLDESDFADSANSSGKRSTCNLSQPDDWSTLDIAARILQDKLLTETGDHYPWLKIRTLIKP